MKLEEIKKLFKSKSNLIGFEILSIVQLKGDASSRRYYRVAADKGTFIFMELDDAVGPLFDGDVKLIQRETFPKVQQYLSGSGIPVPQLICEFPEQKSLVVEDVGDVSLGRLIRDGDAADVKIVKMALGAEPLKEAYKKAVDVMLKIQALPRTDNFVFKRSLGKDSLKAEVFRFAEMYAEPNGASPKVINEIKKELEGLADKVGSYPQVLSHRDLMPMNIHFKVDGSAVLIDFQDMCLAPQGYDLGALLTDRDFDFDIGQPLIEEILSYAEQRLKIPNLREMYTASVLQRTLRLIGQFTRLAATRSPSYGAFVPGCIKRAKGLLGTAGNYPAIEKYLDCV
jgi:hypothetical protein